MDFSMQGLDLKFQIPIVIFQLLKLLFEDAWLFFVFLTINSGAFPVLDEAVFILGKNPTHLTHSFNTDNFEIDLK